MRSDHLHFKNGRMKGKYSFQYIEDSVFENCVFDTKEMCIRDRYEILMERLEESETMEMPDMRDALNSVSKDNVEEFASTEWSALFNLNTGEARYYHRENYETCYRLQLEK